MIYHRFSLLIMFGLQIYKMHHYLKMCLSFAEMDESDKRRIKNCKRFTEERGRLLQYTGFPVRYTCLYFINKYDVPSVIYLGAVVIVIVW